MIEIMNEIEILSEDAFYDFYMPRCKPLFEPSDEVVNEIRSGIEAISEEVRQLLVGRWNEGEDFEISYDWNVCRSHSLGIYSKSIHNRQFLESVTRCMDKWPDWILHVACECDDCGIGQIVIANRRVYADGSGSLDYGVFCV